MKKIWNVPFALALFFLLAACNQPEDASSQVIPVEDETSNAAEAETESQTGEKGVTINAFLPENKLNTYGETTILVVIQNNSDESVMISQGDFSLRAVKQDMDIGLTLGETVEPEVLKIAPQEEDYTFTYFNIGMAMEDSSIDTIHPEDYKLIYTGDMEITGKSITLSDQVPIEYQTHSATAIYERENGSSTEQETLESEENGSFTSGSNNGLVISLYDMNDDGAVYVRVENMSNQSITYDSTNLTVFDDMTDYEIRYVYDSAFDPVMTIAPGKRVDYREFFELSNYTDQSEDEISENIQGARYVSEYGEYEIYGTYYQQEAPEDFLDE